MIGKIIWFFWDWKGSLLWAMFAMLIPTCKGIWDAYRGQQQKQKQEDPYHGQMTPLPDLFHAKEQEQPKRCHMDHKNMCCLLMLFWCMFVSIMLVVICISSYYHWHDTYDAHIKHLEFQRVTSQNTVEDYKNLRSDQKYRALHDSEELTKIILNAEHSAKLTDQDIKVQSDDHAWNHLRNDFKEWLTVIPGYDYFSDHSDVTAIALTNTIDLIRHSWMWTILSFTLMAVVVTWCFRVVASTCQEAFMGMVGAVRSSPAPPAFHHNYPAFEKNSAFSFQTTDQLSRQFSTL